MNEPFGNAHKLAWMLVKSGRGGAAEPFARMSDQARRFSAAIRDTLATSS